MKQKNHEVKKSNATQAPSLEGTVRRIGLALSALGSHAQVPAAPVSPAPVVTYEYDAQGNPTRTIQAPNVGGLDLKTVKRPTRP